MKHTLMLATLFVVQSLGGLTQVTQTPGDSSKTPRPKSLKVGQVPMEDEVDVQQLKEVSEQIEREVDAILALLGPTGPSAWLQFKSVQTSLDLSAEQIQSTRAWCVQSQKELRDKLINRHMAYKESNYPLTSIMRMHLQFRTTWCRGEYSQLEDFLNRDQLAHLREADLRHSGIQAFARGELHDIVKATPQQVQHFYHLYGQLLVDMLESSQAMTEQQLTTLGESAREKLYEQLTTQQRHIFNQWKSRTTEVDGLASELATKKNAM